MSNLFDDTTDRDKDRLAEVRALDQRPAQGDMEERGPWVWVAGRSEWAAEASSLGWKPGGPQSALCPECQRSVGRRSWQLVEELADHYWRATCPGENCQARLVALND